MIKIISNSLIDIDIYHKQLFINHFWDLNNYMIFQICYLLNIFKNNFEFFNNAYKNNYQK